MAVVGGVVPGVAAAGAPAASVIKVAFSVDGDPDFLDAAIVSGLWHLGASRRGAPRSVCCAHRRELDSFSSAAAVSTFGCGTEHMSQWLVATCSPRGACTDGLVHQCSRGHQ